ncbi:glycosyltransferase [Gramella lutea]|uniref:Glycosyltransferase n=1 Tax=Christiangramia lutea TaxID=1607951 RepID=A0A9X1UZY6_9FLAO|nr:glycosyltransferase [Christiangramia lutea]MCH4821580.1 glycosyltransferase [Christiangramia lutea]
MKILMVSIFSSHFFNWVNQLEGAGHEVFWLDVKDSRTIVNNIDFVEQIVGWRYKADYPGRYFIKKKLPGLNKFINTYNERSLSNIFEKLVRQIQPDVVHSFVMYLSAVPIFQVMKNYKEIKWIYSSWGSDIYYYSRFEKEKREMMEVFPHLDYLFTDCQRDYSLALNFGFNGEFLGVFPGRGGYDLEKTNKLLRPRNTRKKILIKGYQGKHGRCIEVLMAIMKLKDKLNLFDLIVFGADEEVVEFISTSELGTWSNFTVLGKIDNDRVLTLMGDSLIYIGNSASDGIPNTLIESIIMGAFPIQSNPGGATEELIIDGKNGFLINDPEYVLEITLLIEEAIGDALLLEKAENYNIEFLRPKFDRDLIRASVLEKYNYIEKELAE